MKKSLIILLVIIGVYAKATPKTIHVFVALCDNENQGIVPVSESLGNGQRPDLNLYWGAMYGVKSYFNRIAPNWKMVKEYSKDGVVLEAVLFKHKTKEVYLLAEAYDGAHIKKCTQDFLLASKGYHEVNKNIEGKELQFGGKSNLIAYVGHDGLMDFTLPVSGKENIGQKKDAVILACYSKSYFSDHLKASNSNPLVWSTHLMAPEAYVLEGIVDAWVNGKSNSEVREAAAQAYHKYQKCGINGARNLLVTGY